MSKRAGALLSGLAALLLMASSCASKDAVAVSGSIGNVQLAVAQGPLVTTLEGGFDVALELGARASGGTDVTFSEFSLLRAGDSTPVLASEKLSVVSSQSGPVHLNPGDKATVHLQIGELRNGAVAPAEADQADYEAICCAGTLVISGTMLDSASGSASTPLSSIAFTPSGCSAATCPR